MDFQEAERRFHNLEAAYHAGQCDQKKYDDALAQIKVIDSAGRTWQLQAHTGAWFVFSGGQWTQASPYPPPVPAPVAPLPPPPAAVVTPQAAAPVRVVQTAAPAAPKRRSRVGCILGVLALVLVAIAVVGVGIWAVPKFLPGMLGAATLQPSTGSAAQPSKTPVEQAPVTKFSQEAATTAQADGAPQTDAHGVSLTAPQGSLGEGVTAEMVALKAEGELAQALAENYSVDTPFYAVTTQSQDSGTGLSELSFPAASPASRVLAIVDEQYPVLLGVKPQDGKLTVHTLLGAKDVKGLEPVGTTDAGGSIYYTVITPKSGSSLSPNASPQMVGFQAQSAEGVNCSPELRSRARTWDFCRANAAGTVVISYDPKLKLTAPQADLVAQEVAARMETYAGLGFSAARLSADAPMIVIVASSNGDPLYHVRSGAIYLPEDIAQDMAGKGKSLWHEMGHWVENRVYNMTWAYWRGQKTWWLEVAAENMVMLAAPEYITENMATYGTITADDNSLAFANSPYQWPSDFYVHAQLVKVMMCDGGCPLSQAGFVEAINKGIYPYEDSAAQAALTANLDDYARYLLGAAPLKANSGISLAAVQTQGSYGQSVNISMTTKSMFGFLHDGNAPQLTTVNKNSLDTLVFAVPLQKDGVYPLEITSGRDGKYTALPAMLTVAAGLPLYYRVDGGEVQYHDGSKDLVLGPIHSKIGISTVRIVALSKNGAQSFNAHLDPIELKGAWVIVPGELVSNGVTCTQTEHSTIDASALPQGLATISSIILAAGDMTPDASGPSLDWALVAARLPEGAKADQFTFKGTALLTADGVELQTELDFPKPAQSSQAIPPVAAAPGLVAAVVLPASLLRRPLGKKARALTIVLLCLAAGLLLSGCFGMAIYGTIGADTKITGLQYTGGEEKGSWTVGQAPAGKPVWTITAGTATYQMNFSIDATTTDAEGNDTTETNTCTGPATFKITGGIYTDAAVIIPQSSN